MTAAIAPETRRVFTFAPVIPGRRRRFASRRRAYLALAEQLLTRKYTEVYEDFDGDGGYTCGSTWKVREWTERGRDRFGGEFAQKFADRMQSDEWRNHIDAVAKRLRLRDEHRAKDLPHDQR